MARMARIVIPHIPHHITQRGNRSQKVFFSDKDKEYYIGLLHKYALTWGVSFWAYCLMDNHVHMIAVPEKEESLARGIGDTHKYYTRMVNFRDKWRGYLWQGRFSSFPLDERHLYAAIRYVELNPVRAGIVKKAEDYRFSSAYAHVNNKRDILLSDNFMIKEIKDWKDFLTQGDDKNDAQLFNKHTRTGRPLGQKEFIEKLEKITGRILTPGKPGRKGKKK